MMLNRRCSVIVKKPKGWYVLSEKGKHMGGPYKTRQEAEDRLKQIEMFKHIKKDK